MSVALIYPACKACVPYYFVICGLSGSTIAYLLNGMIVEEKQLLNTKYVFLFLHRFCLNFSFEEEFT
jgi:hypothetical protein